MQESTPIRPTLFEETLAAHLSARDEGDRSGKRTLVDLWPDMAWELEEFLALEADFLLELGRVPVSRREPGATEKRREHSSQSDAQFSGQARAQGAAALADPRSSGLAAGTIFGGCRIEEELRPGSWGRRYRATQLFLRRPVTVEVLRRSVADDPGQRARLGLELRLIARLDHPAFPRLFGVEGGEGRLWIITSPCSGTSLDASEQRAGLPLASRIAITRTACSALAHARKMGVLFGKIEASDLTLSAEGKLFVTGGHPTPLPKGTGDTRADLISLGRALWPTLVVKAESQRDATSGR
ncbi:MAG: hypothetical protein ACI841_000070 [Planctomycetota bacterium]|jgi:hypothetical protein